MNCVGCPRLDLRDPDTGKLIEGVVFLEKKYPDGRTTRFPFCPDCHAAGRDAKLPF